MLQSSNCCRWGLAEQLVSLAFHTSEHHSLHSTHFSTPSGTPLEGSNDKNNARRKQNASTLVHLPCECGGERSMYPCLYVCVCVSECVCVKGATVRQESQTQSTLPSGDHCSPSRSLVSVSKCCKQTLMLSNQSAQEACTPHKQIFISQLNPLLKDQTKGHHERILSPCTHCY